MELRGMNKTAPNESGLGEQRSSTWKWGVCGLLLLASSINYMDRQTLAGASVRISQEFHLSQKGYGEIEAVFGYAFAAGSLVFGWMADRFSVRWVYGTVLALWSVAGIITGWASTSNELLFCRGLLGFFEAGHWPCAVRTTRLILDERERSMGNGLLQSGATFGAIVTPLLLPLLFQPGTGGWRPPFFVIGIAGLFWLIPWFLVVRSSDLQSGVKGKGAVEEVGTDFLKVLLSGRMLGILWIVACINTAWQVFRAWLPKFLQEGRGYSETHSLYFNSAWFAAADLGCLVAGAAVVWMSRGTVSASVSRLRVFSFCALLTASAALIPWLQRGPLLLGILLLIGVGALGVFPLYHTFTQELSGRHQGKITGVAGVVAWILSAQAHLFLGNLADRRGSMDLGLALAGFLPVLAVIPLWFFRKNSRHHSTLCP